MKLSILLILNEENTFLWWWSERVFSWERASYCYAKYEHEIYKNGNLGWIYGVTLTISGCSP